MAYDRELLKRYQTQFESRRKYPYNDKTGKYPKLLSGGKITIGVGWNLTDNGLPEDIIDLLHDRALDNTEKELRRAFPWFDTLDDVRQLVLMDMGFNLGIPKFQTFKTVLGLTEQGRFLESSKAMLRTLWARQVGARATILALMMETGKLPMSI